MKKILSILSAAAMVFSLTACGMSEETQTNASESSDSVTAVTEEAALDNSVSETESNDHGMATEEAESMEQSGDTDTTNILVAYFSWADNAVLADDVDAVASPSVIPPGNVQQLAGWVQEETGGHLFSIQVTDPYPSDWDECLARANQERGDDARPQLEESVENLESYDVVFLGYPNWWYGVPMALLSFLEQNDLSGKQVYLFCSHGTGGLANSVEIITQAAPDALISDHIFDCYEEDAASSQEAIQNWVRELGYSLETEGEQEGKQALSRRILVQFGEDTVVYELNDSTAADSLYEQLPLTIEVEDYSTNEKIFYPPEELDTSNSPMAQGGAGTLAYYAPWGDVVMFYGDYGENSSLFELGQAVLGGELVSEMSGTITIEADNG
ncbi:cyclophilin-like fold protein [Candidatus Acetatifactor stercoripullorum]|uniref:cyclophilin-like fold protein n=1 Tax=Candidatus Acetatifactor stercoripullorum TaxID=2838414 RepID=UPI00298E55EB|nr:cyclophilin-like fold protein [Candidatus Acetatifactor stercoripullorum]